MCGIFGIINFGSKANVSEQQLREPLLTMLHRGPDDQGILVDRYAGIGMRRLSIIDIKGGHQPISNETGDISIVFNGEIYNYQELRTTLLERGHKFKTTSDTEVILHLYEEYGQRCPAMLNGMFAFAVWDKKQDSLFIARDRIGIKPLFYSLSNGSFMFSSEIRALITAGAPRDIDMRALVNYFSFYYISSPRTIFSGIRRLPQGHSILFKNGAVKMDKYWNFGFRPEKMSEEEASKLIRDSLFDSVKRQLMSEVPLGLFLSSGMDSTSILAMMQKAGAKLKTYSMGFEGGGESFSELDEARLVARQYNSEHHECILKPGDVEASIPLITRHLCEPHGDWTQAGFYHLSKESKRDMTVVLSGAGGDELFAGYPTLTAAKIAKYYRMLPAAARGLIKHIVNALPVSFERLSFDYKARSFVAGADLSPERAHLRYKEIFSLAERRKLLYNVDGSFDPFEVFEQYIPDVRDEEVLNRLLYLDMRVFLPECSLQYTDMTTMMNSQECRVPFLDNSIIDLSERIPFRLKMKGFTTKHILRKSLIEFLPEQIIRMHKKGFVLPTGVWLRSELKGFARDIVSDAQKRNTLGIDFNYVNKVFNDHFEGKSDNTRKMTCLLSFFIWQGQQSA